MSARFEPLKGFEANFDAGERWTTCAVRLSGDNSHVQRFPSASMLVGQRYRRVRDSWQPITMCGIRGPSEGATLGLSGYGSCSGKQVQTTRRG
jgi:hypothetical protein